MGEQWAIVELMGHVRTAGRLTEEERFGSKLGRLDVPQADGTFFTQFFGGQSVYRITHVSEAAARAVALSTHTAPVQSWELPRALPATEARHPAGVGCDDPDDDDTDSDLDPGF